MNSGTARSAKFCACVSGICTMMVAGRLLCCTKNSAPEMPTAKAIGMPTIRKTINAMKTISMTRITSISSSSVDYSFAICF